MRKRISYILILTMLFTGVYMVPAVQEAHGEGAGFSAEFQYTVTADGFSNYTGEEIFTNAGADVTIDEIYNEGETVTIELTPPESNVDVTIGAISSTTKTMTTSGECTFEIPWEDSAGITGTGNITFNLAFEEPDEGDAADYVTVSVTGQRSASARYFISDRYIDYNISTSNTSGTINIVPTEAVSEVGFRGDSPGIYVVEGEDLIYSFELIDDTARGYFDLSLNDESPLPDEGVEVLNLVITITYSTGSSGGGGGGGSSQTEEKVNVINETNEPNESSDTILTPNSTVEEDGTSSTNISEREVEALIELAKEHTEDVPEGENEAVINIEDTASDGNTEYEVGIQHSEAEKLSNSVVDILSVNTPIGDFRIRTDELTKQLKKDNGKLKLKLLKIENKERPGIDAELLVGDAEVVTFDGTYEVEIRIPYEPAENEDTSALYIEYIAEDGSTVTVTESRYDAENKWLAFFAPHLSKYGVAYNPVLFKDVPAGNWASSYVTFLATRGVINGMGDGKFYPNAKVTKAQFINMMTKAFSAAKLGKNVIKSYKDVRTDAWYAKSMGWSYMNNLSNALAVNGRIYPDAALTREDMATLSNNISLGLGLRLKDNKGASTFLDSGSISGYAASGVQRMTSCGILAGTGGKFFPKQGLTRAEAAKVISTLMTGMK